MNIAKIFTLIETNKEALEIETYLLSQTTLEQIFISFARKQAGQENSNEGAFDSHEFVAENARGLSGHNNNPSEASRSVHFNRKRTYSNNGFIAEETITF